MFELHKQSHLLPLPCPTLSVYQPVVKVHVCLITPRTPDHFSKHPSVLGCLYHLASALLCAGMSAYSRPLFKYLCVFCCVCLLCCWLTGANASSRIDLSTTLRVLLSTTDVNTHTYTHTHAGMHTGLPTHMRTHYIDYS